MLVEGKSVWGQNKIAALLNEKQLDPIDFPPRFYFVLGALGI